MGQQMLGSRGFPLALSWELSPLSGGLTLELVQNEAERGFGCLQHHRSSFWGVRGGGFSTAPLLPAAGRGLWREVGRAQHQGAPRSSARGARRHAVGGGEKGVGLCPVHLFSPNFSLPAAGRGLAQPPDHCDTRAGRRPGGGTAPAVPVLTGFVTPGAASLPQGGSRGQAVLLHSS